MEVEFLRLLLTPIEQGIKVIVEEASSVGEGEIESQLPFYGQIDTRLTLLKSLDRTRFRPEVFPSQEEQEWMVRIGLLNQQKTDFSPHMQEIIGRELYRSLFPDNSKTKGLLEHAIAIAEKDSRQLHLQIKISDEVSKRARLFDYPWELIHDERGFLAQRRVSISRYIAFATAQPRLARLEKIKVLLVSSRAFDRENHLEPLSRQEHETVINCLTKAQAAGHIKLEILEPATLSELHRYIIEHSGEESPHVIHFNGHGLFGRRCISCKRISPGTAIRDCNYCTGSLSEPQGYLLFEHDENPFDYVSAQRLATVLGIANEQEDAGPQPGISLIVLSACQSGSALGSDSVFNGVAQSLIRERIPAAVAMQFPVTVEAADRFSESFYRSLGERHSLAKAVTHGRIGMDIEGDQWYRPVLYLRWQDNEGGQLFAKSGMKASQVLSAIRPKTSIPFERNPLFYPRLGEFEHLETLLFGQESLRTPTRLALIGMGGVGKTRLAVELAYHYLERFPAGVFWMTATGTNLFDWQRQFAELAAKTEYLQSNEDLASPDLEVRRARHFCRYLANHKDSLLILDNVENPALLITALPDLAGSELACTVLCTSRVKNWPDGITQYPVKQMPEEAALNLLLKTTRPTLLEQVLAGNLDAEAKAARSVCHVVGYLPLALVHLRGLLKRDQYLTLVRLAQVLKERGALEVAKKPDFDAAPLFPTFDLSWQQVGDEAARQLFKLASYFPEATPIPLWLLGLAAGLGENGEIFEPLGEALLQLQELSLVEELLEDQVYLHPIMREFGRKLIVEEGDKGRALLEEAGERLASEFTDLNNLERRALQESYWVCLEQVQTAYIYVALLGVSQAESFRRIIHWLGRESYLLGNEQWWPTLFPCLFFQQLYNHAVEEGQLLSTEKAPAQWIQQTEKVGAEELWLKAFVHEDEVTSVAFSPDGNKILTGSCDKTARLWQTDNGKLLGILEGHTSYVRSVAFSPDGSKIVTGSNDRTARLWQTDNGKLLGILEGHTSYVQSAVFSPDGSKVLTASSKTARLWETDSGTLLETIDEHIEPLMSVAFSPDGKRMLAGSWGGIDGVWAGVWDIESGKLLLHFDVHSAYTFDFHVTSVAYSPDGTKVLIGLINDPTQLWEAESGKLLQTLTDDEPGVNGVVFSPDGNKILAGLCDGTAHLWETKSGQLLSLLVGHASQITSVAFSPDGSKILTGSSDKSARLWETPIDKLSLPANGHTSEITSIAFSPDGSKALTGSEDATACLWETDSGKLLWQTNRRMPGIAIPGHYDAVRGTAFSPDGNKVLTGSLDESAELWDVKSGSFLRKYEHWDYVHCVAFSPDGSTVLTGCSDSKAHLFDVESGKLLRSLKGHNGSVRQAVFSSDGRYILTASDDQTVRLWKTKSGKLLKTLEGHSKRVTNVSFSPDSGKLLSISWDNTIRLWETASGTLLRNLDDSDSVSNAFFSFSGDLVIVCHSDGRVFFWPTSELGKGRPIGLYTSIYRVKALHWQDTHHVILADNGGPSGRPHFHRLKLIGMK